MSRKERLLLENESEQRGGSVHLRPHADRRRRDRAVARLRRPLPRDGADQGIDAKIFINMI